MLFQALSAEVYFLFSPVIYFSPTPLPIYRVYNICLVANIIISSLLILDDVPKRIAVE